MTRRRVAQDQVPRGSQAVSYTATALLAVFVSRGPRGGQCQVGSPVSLHGVAGWEAARGRLRQAAWYIDTAARLRQAPDASAYGDLIQAFAKHSQMREAMAWMKDAKASKLMLPADVYAAITPNRLRTDVAPREALGRAGPKEWWNLVRRMRHEGLWEGQVPWQQVLHWLEQAFKSKSLAPVEAVEDAILRLQRADQPNLAAQWLQDAVGRRLQPQANVFRGVIMQCCEDGASHTAEKLVEMMVSLRLPPSSDIYRALCTSKAILNQKAEVQRWLQMLKDEEKDLAPFALMSCNYAAEGKTNAEVWLDRARTAQLEPDLECYNKVLAAHVRAPKGCAMKWSLPMSRAKAACRCFEDMIAKALQPTSESYRPLVRGFARAGDWRLQLAALWALQMLIAVAVGFGCRYKAHGAAVALSAAAPTVVLELVGAMQGWPGQLPGVEVRLEVWAEEPAGKRQRLQESFGAGFGTWPDPGGSCGSGGACGSCSGLDQSAAMGAPGCGLPWSGGCGMNPIQFAQMQMAQMQAMAAFTAKAEEPPAPAPVDTEERYYGLIRDYNESQGFGFIECEDAKFRYGMDVFIHRRQMFGLAKGDEVSFVIVRNSQGQPQARHVIKKEETARILEKRKDRERREAAKLQAKKQASEKVFTPSNLEGKVMSEEEARRFQASLKRGR
ncbi:Cold shock protein CspD [Durusdinium trenchii]|uniref:Cold shock protein CspD n=1 Tax=Durusdinium trenchii TaxID=1381693 RepID=A0ABP0RUQ2_9DINO